MKNIIIVLLLATTYSCTTNKSITRRHTVDACPMWADCIHNPENEEFVVEVAFNNGITTAEVTQEMFNQRYSN